MTKLKTGDRVVPGRFDQLNYKNPCFNSDMERLVNVPGEITRINCYGHCEVHGWFWPEHALTPVQPKWEPKYGELVEGESPISHKIYYGNYIGVDPNNLDEHIISNKDTKDCYAVINIRPIAPSPEDEIGSILCKLIGGDNYILRDAKADIMAIFNRHKEGEWR